jgi:predicted SAM-dependent methyltransferase
MDEASKTTKRRLASGDPRYKERWVVGRCIDVGCGHDPLKKEDWPRLTEVAPYDQILGHRDATFLPEHADETFDTVHSSHCLEHLQNPRAALVNWLRVLKPGGFIVCTVPEELLYECGKWPSRFNPDHKNSFTLRGSSVMPQSINVLFLLWKVGVVLDVEHISLMTTGWDPAKFGTDQTAYPDSAVECAIEFIIRKPDPGKGW